jgi:hypothetical protein
MITKGIVGFKHLSIDLLFPFFHGDNTLRRHRGILEPYAQKQHHLKDKTIKHSAFRAK